MKKLSTQIKGNIAEFQVICALMNKGCNVFKSCSEDCRCDLIFEHIDNLYKVQVKSSNYDPKKGIIKVLTHSVQKATIRTYKGEVDYFGVYCPQLDKCYLIPEEDVFPSGIGITIRIDPPRNNQTSRAHWAKDYEI